MKRMITATVLLGVIILAAAACDGTTAEREQVVANDVPIATLFYVGFGFEQSPPYKSFGGLGTTG